VSQLEEQVRQTMKEVFEPEDAEAQLVELEAELKDKDLQEQGRTLFEVLDYLNNPPEEDGGEEQEGERPPYEGPEALEALWKEVVELCNEEDVPTLEEELKSKTPEDQWVALLDVRDYLLTDPEEQEAFEKWTPSDKELEAEWAELLQCLPDEDLDEIKEDWSSGDYEEKKRLVWDVRKHIEEQGVEEEEEDANAQQPPPQRGAPRSREFEDDEALGKNEVRRRGARRGAEYEYNYEYDFGAQGDKDGGDWDEYYSKEAKRSRGGGRSFLLVSGVMVLVLVLGVLLTATVLADDDEPVLQSALRLLRVA